MSKTTVTREARHLRRRGFYFGTDARDRQPLYLQWKWLKTHLHVLGPTGQGKSRLLLWLFQLLCHTGRPIVLVDFKGGLYKMCRDWALTHGFSKRLVLFDLSADTVPGYNPLRENGLRLDLQAQWVAEGVKSAWGQATFDATPQLARYLYLCLYVSRALTISLVEGLDVLRPSPALREQALVRIKDPFVHGALLAFDNLNDRRKEELAASTLARLEAFCRDEIVRTVICSEQSLDPEAVLTERRILLLDFAKCQPLLPDPLKLLARMFTSDFLAHMYKGYGEGKFNENNPVYFMVDEVQNMATRQLCDALDEGRGIGLHCILAHQHLAQLALEDQSGYLLKSVMNDARTKLIFGDLDPEDLEVLAKNVMLDQYSPWPTKDQIGKTARLITTKGRGMSWPRSETEGESESSSRGITRSTTNGTEESESEAHTRAKSRGRSLTHSDAHTAARGRAHTTMDGRAHATMQATSRMAGHADASSAMDSLGSGSTGADSSGTTFSYDNPYGALVLIPNTMTSSRNHTSGMSTNAAHATSAGENDFTAEGTSHGEADIVSHAEADTASESKADTLSISAGTSEVDTEAFTTGRTTGRSLAVQEGESDTVTQGTNRSITKGVTPSISEQWSEGESETIQPLSPEEQRLLHIQKLKALPQAHFCLKVPGKPAIFCRAPWVAEPTITRKTLQSGLERVYALPYYTKVEVLNGEAHEMTAPLHRALPAPQASDEDDAIDCWRTERPTL